MQLISPAAKADLHCWHHQTELLFLISHIPIKHVFSEDLKNMVELYVIPAVIADYLRYEDNMGLHYSKGYPRSR